MNKRLKKKLNNTSIELVKAETPKKTGGIKAIALNNIANRNMGNEKNGLKKPSQFSFKLLRAIARRDAIIRICINVIKKTVSQSKWQIKVKDRYKKDKNSEKLYAEEINEVYELFENMNDNDENMRILLDRVIEDILVLDAGCLHGGEQLELKDGRKLPISEIVNNKIEGEILSYNEDIKINEYKKIVGWHKNKLNGRSWVKVNYRYARNMGKNGRKSTWFTDDHKLLTNNGWKEIKDIDLINDKVITSWKEPNELQKQVIYGAILGDGHLQGRKNSYRRVLNLGHGLKQESWLDLKVKALSCFNFSEKKYDTRKRNQDKISTMVISNSNSTPWLEKEAKRWLGENFIKSIPKELEITDLLLATWFMDDGHGCTNYYKGVETSIASYINCCSISLENQDILVEKINNYGIECNIQKAGKYSRIYITIKGTQVLFSKISKYIPEELRYKLQGFKGDNFNPKVWELGDSNIFMDKIELKYGNPTGGKSNIPLTTYCIDVEDNHNFFTSDIAAHNCIEVVRSNDGKKITQLNSVDSASIKPLSNKYGLSPGNVAYKQYVAEEVVAEFTRDELLYIMANPSNALEEYGYGLSPIESIMLQVEASMEAEAYNMKTFASDNVPPGLIDLGDVSVEEAEDVMATWNATVIGNTQAMKFMWGSGADRKYTPFQKSNKDMQFSQYIEWLSRIKLATYGLTAQDANIDVDLNRSTAEVHASMSNARGVRSMKRLIEEYFTRGIIRKMGDSDGFRKIEFSFIDIDTLEDMELRAKTDKLNIESGIYAPKYVQERDGYPLETLQTKFTQDVITDKKPKKVPVKKRTTILNYED